MDHLEIVLKPQGSKHIDSEQWTISDSGTLVATDLDGVLFCFPPNAFFYAKITTLINRKVPVA